MRIHVGNLAADLSGCLVLASGVFAGLARAAEHVVQEIGPVVHRLALHHALRPAERAWLLGLAHVERVGEGQGRPEYGYGLSVADVPAYAPRPLLQLVRGATVGEGPGPALS